jgi:hypothetical protein
LSDGLIVDEDGDDGDEDVVDGEGLEGEGVTSRIDREEMARKVIANLFSPHVQVPRNLISFEHKKKRLT